MHFSMPSRNATATPVALCDETSLSVANSIASNAMPNCPRLLDHYPAANRCPLRPHGRSRRTGPSRSVQQVSQITLRCRIRATFAATASMLRLRSLVSQTRMRAEYLSRVSPARAIARVSVSVAKCGFASRNTFDRFAKSRRAARNPAGTSHRQRLRTCSTGNLARALLLIFVNRTAPRRRSLVQETKQETGSLKTKKPKEDNGAMLHDLNMIATRPSAWTTPTRRQLLGSTALIALTAGL